MYTISGHLFVFLFLLQNLHSSIHKGFLPLMPISIFYTAGSYVEVTPVSYIIGLWYMHIHFRDSCFERVISQQDVNKANKGMETACTEFLYTKDSSFSTFVSQVFLCDTVVFGSKTMFFCCSFHLSLDVILMFPSLVCVDTHLIPGCSSQNITPVDVICSQLTYLFK